MAYILNLHLLYVCVMLPAVLGRFGEPKCHMEQKTFLWNFDIFQQAADFY